MSSSIVRGILAVFIMTVFCSGCDSLKNESFPRKESVKVYTLNQQDNLDIIQVGLEGEPSGQIHLISSAELEVKDEVGGWFHVDSVDDLGDGHRVINFTADPLTGTVVERYGTLGVVCPSIYLGKFLKVRQGYSPLKEFDLTSLPDGHLVLNAQTQQYTTEYVDAGINKAYNIVLSFRAYAEGFQGTTVPLRVRILGGTVVDETWADSEMFDVRKGSYFGADNLYYVFLSNKGKLLSANTKFVLELGDEEGSASVHVNNLMVCRVEASELEDDPDKDPNEEEDEEN